MKIKSITPLEPEEAVCIEVDHPQKLFAVGEAGKTQVLTHNSVVQRNIVFACIMRPDSWRFMGIDLKRVELSAYRAYSNVVLGIATTLEDALIILRFGNEAMMKRYTEMEQLGVNNFLDLPTRGQALLIMVDEAGELLSPGGVKALVESTLLRTPKGLVPMRDVQVGDELLGLNHEPVTVMKKYEPQAQERLALTVKQDASGRTEDFIAGEEHYWTVYFEEPSGERCGPETVTTKFLHEFQKAQQELPPEERTTVKMKRARL